MKSIRNKEMILAVFVAINVYWSAMWAYIYGDSLIDNNGVFRIDCNFYGEGWSEVILFICVILVGLYLIASIIKGDFSNE